MVRIFIYLYCIYLFLKLYQASKHSIFIQTHSTAQPTCQVPCKSYMAYHLIFSKETLFCMTFAQLSDLFVGSLLIRFHKILLFVIYNGIKKLYYKLSFTGGLIFLLDIDCARLSLEIDLFAFRYKCPHMVLFSIVFI